jgi:hypothetical protein
MAVFIQAIMASFHSRHGRPQSGVGCWQSHSGARHVTLGYPAYYPLHPVQLRRPIKAVLMDSMAPKFAATLLDLIIEQTTSLLMIRRSNSRKSTYPLSQVTAF